MKAPKLILAVALLTSLVSIGFAGPGPQYWAQLGKNNAAQKAQTTAPAESAKQVASSGTCACCAVPHKG